jgi:Tfp pilus assembly protein PilZ
MRMARPDDLFRSYHLRDVSLGGMFVKTDQPRPMGTDVDVKVEFVRGGAFEARGKVVRVVRARDLPDRSQPTGIGIGIEFTQMTEDSRHLLEELLEDPTSTIEPPDPRTEP